MSKSTLMKLFAFLIYALSTQALLAQPQTPRVYLNERIRLVTLARSERAILRFDLRPIRGEHLKIKLYGHDQTLNDPPVREWLIHRQFGEERLSFKDLPVKLYTLIAFCSNTDGEALAYAAPPVHVEYGDWRAWEKFKYPDDVAKTPPEGFEGLDVATNSPNQDIGLSLSPPAVVLKPGETQVFKALFRNLKSETVKWKLVGKGKLSPNEDGTYTYQAPTKQVENELFRIEIRSSSKPELTGSATVLLSNADQDQIK